MITPTTANRYLEEILQNPHALVTVRRINQEKRTFTLEPVSFYKYFGQEAPLGRALLIADDCYVQCLSYTIGTVCYSKAEGKPASEETVQQYTEESPPIRILEACYSKGGRLWAPLIGNSDTEKTGSVATAKGVKPTKRVVSLGSPDSPNSSSASSSRAIAHAFSPTGSVDSATSSEGPFSPDHH